MNKSIDSFESALYTRAFLNVGIKEIFSNYEKYYSQIINEMVVSIDRHLITSEICSRLIAICVTEKSFNEIKKELETFSIFASPTIYGALQFLTKYGIIKSKRLFKTGIQKSYVYNSDWKNHLKLDFKEVNERARRCLYKIEKVRQ